MAEVSEKPEISDQWLQKPKSMIHRTHFPAVLQEKIFNAFLLAAKVSYKSNQGNPDRYLKEGFFTTEKYITNFSGIKSKNTEHILESIKSLQKMILRFDYFDEDEHLVEKRVFAPISEVAFLPDGRLNFFLPRTIIEAVSNPNAYYNSNAFLAGSLTSVYAIAIYEMGLIHMGGSVRFTLTQFREYMGLKPEEFAKNHDLKRYVIDKGCDEVCLKCSMIVTYRLIQEGRGNRVKGIEFSFEPSPEPVVIPRDHLQLEIVAAIFASVQSYINVNDKMFSMVQRNLEQHGEEWVLSNIESFLKRMETPGLPPVKSIGGLFMTTFEKDYGKDIRGAKYVTERLKKHKAQSAAESQSPSNEEEAALEEYRLKSEKYLAHFSALPKKEQKDILKKIRLEPQIDGLFLAGPEDTKIVFYLSEVLGVVL